MAFLAALLFNAPTLNSSKFLRYSTGRYGFTKESYIIPGDTRSARILNSNCVVPVNSNTGANKRLSAILIP